MPTHPTQTRRSFNSSVAAVAAINADSLWATAKAWSRIAKFARQNSQAAYLQKSRYIAALYRLRLLNLVYAELGSNGAVLVLVRFVRTQEGLHVPLSMLLPFLDPECCCQVESVVSSLLVPAAA